MANDTLDHAINDVREILVSIVKSAPDPDRVHLTWVGNQFSKRKKATFEAYINFLSVDLSVDFGAVKMMPFIERHCQAVFELKKQSEGQVTVNLRSEPEMLLPVPAKTYLHQDAFVSRRYRRGVFAAFIKPLAVVKRRYIDVEHATFNDVDSEAKVGLGVEVQRKFIDTLAAGEKVDSEAVQRRILSWIDYNKVNAATIIDDDRRDQMSSLMDLLRIIETLPADVSAQWSIPATVLLNLKRS